MRLGRIFMLKRNCYSTRNNLKSLDDIPGPLSLPLIGSLWKYIPFIGNYKFNRLDVTGELKLKEYGKVMKEVMGPGVVMVNIFDPKDIETVFKAGGKLPERRSHLAIAHYRKSRPHLYKSAGLFPTNGEEWWRLRQAFQKPVSPLQETRDFLPNVDKITQEFLDKMITHGTVVDDFLPLVSKLNLELIWEAMFAERLQCFDSQNDSTAVKLINAAEACNESILATDSSEFIWTKFKTKVYDEFEKNMEFIEKVSIESIIKAKATVCESSSKSIVHSYLNMPNIDEKDILGIVVDLLLGGVDTTSYTSCFLFYHLATAEAVKQKLYEESCKILPNKSSCVTKDTLNEATYTRAILKEVFRLNPISIGTSRTLQQTVVVSGYELPKGVIVLCQNMVACRQEYNFPSALEFIPERWNKDDPRFRPISPYLVLPFGYGLRSCLARRRSEQNLLTLLLKIGRNFNVKWIGDGSLNVLTPLINKPDRPVKLVFSTP